MKYKFTEKDAYKLGWEGLKISSYSEGTDFERASCGVFEVTTHHGKVKSTKSDRIYYVLEGEGYFEIDGQHIDVRPTDVVIVPRNTIYDYFGKMKLFLVHTPAFDPQKEVKYDDAQGHALKG